MKSRNLDRLQDAWNTLQEATDTDNTNGDLIGILIEVAKDQQQRIEKLEAALKKEAA